MTTSPTPAPQSEPYTEPWLRGTHGEVPAAGRAVLHALELAMDDLAKWTAGLTDTEVHSQPFGLNSIAVQLRHIAGSVDRILTYAEGGQLSDQQLASLKAERTGEEPLATLLATVQASLAAAAERICALAAANLETPRTVGRKQLPTSLGGALIHVADHTQRHVGQVVTTARLLKALRIEKR
ncbi:MAG: DinB family protein [Acidobacteriota bacterium]